MTKRGRRRSTHQMLRDEDDPSPSPDAVPDTQQPSTTTHAPDLALQQPSSSTPTSEASTQVSKKSTARGSYKGIRLDKSTEGGKKKLIVSIPPEGHVAPVGENAEKLRNHLGGIVKQVMIAPIWEWSKVMDRHGMVMMEKAMDYFEVNSKSPEKWALVEECGKAKPDTPEEKEAKFRRFCEHSMKDDYRRWKSRLHAHYKAFETAEERRQNAPKDMPPISWAKMCDIFESPEFQHRSEINAANRSLQVIRHSTGPIPFTEHLYRLMDSDTGAQPSCSQIWKACHGTQKSSTGWHDAQSLETYESIVQIEDRPLEEGQNPPQRDDILVEALGHRSGYARGMGSGYKPSKSYQGSSSKSALTSEVAELRTTVAAYEDRFAAQDRRIAEQDRIIALMVGRLNASDRAKGGNSSEIDDSETQPPSSYEQVVFKPLMFSDDYH